MMNLGQLKIYIDRNRIENAIDVWVIEETPKGENMISYNEGEVTVTPINPGEVATAGPFLKLHARFAAELFKAISNYNSENGIKTRDENFIEGKLKATELHLEDMRETVKHYINLK